MTRILLLGGTTEASLMARALADAGLDAVYSYAGRTADPVAQPLPQRIGGFGGVDGLAAYLRAENISHVIDATHPFAANISANAVQACQVAGARLVALERPAWHCEAQDNWSRVTTMAEAAAALPTPAARVFLAIGRQNLDVFAGQPQHHYLLRLVDAPTIALPLPNAEFIIDRGPFQLKGDVELLLGYRIQIIVAKNSGGVGARAKVDAARVLGLPMVMIDRPVLPPREARSNVADVMAWLGHSARRGV